MSKSIRGAAAAAVLVAAAAGARADDRLAPGDVVSMSVVGQPTLDRTAAVGSDGAVSLPLFGEVDAAGRSLAELRDDIRGRVPSTVLRVKAPDGTSSVLAIDPADVLVDVAQRRPVYASGDVAKPGEVPFRPGMTVRQVVALSGGLDPVRMRTGDPFMESERLRGEYVDAWTRFASVQAEVWRLEALAEGRARIEGSLDKVPIDADVRGRILASASGELDFDRSETSSRRAFLDEALARSDRQIGTLRQQEDVQREEVGAARKELDQFSALLGRGLVQGARVTDARRAITSATSLALDVGVELIRAESQRADYQRERDRIDEVAKADASRKLAKARLELEGIRTKLSVTGQMLDYTGVLRSTLRRDGDAARVEIHRVGPDGTAVAVKAGQDTAVEPGDLVDVALDGPSDPPPG